MSESRVLSRLWKIIESRKDEMPEGSYTAELFSRGMQEIAKKVGEEGVEVAVAGLSQTDDRVIYESADLMYHLMVLLSARGLSWDDVERELARRFPEGGE
jgi:phosphoribosyl-ATP pyrophosphohydrolase/phosphoribosyl-AMP cyclohydrolase